MVKEAETIYQVHPLISQRWSARSFSKKSVTQQDILTLLEAASWAPSSMNEQPWEYYYAFNGSAGFTDMWQCLSIGNQLWVKDAPVLMICMAHKNFARNNEPNRHYMHDTGMANANLLAQATSMGIYCHLLGGYDRLKTDEIFRIPEDKEVICYIALGYLGEPEQLEEPFKTREITPRTRKALDEIAKKI